MKRIDHSEVASSPQRPHLYAQQTLPNIHFARLSFLITQRLFLQIALSNLSQHPIASRFFKPSPPPTTRAAGFPPPRPQINSDNRPYGHVHAHDKRAQPTDNHGLGTTRRALFHVASLARRRRQRKPLSARTRSAG